MVFIFLMNSRGYCKIHYTIATLLVAGLSSAGLVDLQLKSSSLQGHTDLVHRHAADHYTTKLAFVAGLLVTHTYHHQ